MAKFHINKNGSPAVCRAKEGNCPFGTIGEHFDTWEKADEFIQDIHKKVYGWLSGMSEDNFIEEINRKLSILASQLEEKINNKIEFTDKEIEERSEIIDDIMSSDYMRTFETTNQYGSFSEDGLFYFEADRAEQQEKLMEKLAKKYENIPNHKKVIISAGMPGAGKTYAITETGDININEYAMINSDDFKEMMAEEGMIPEIEGLTPLERVSLVHQESSYLFGIFSERLTHQNKNIILDLTCADYSKTKSRINKLRNNGYSSTDITMIAIRANPELAKSRVNSRYKDGMNEFIKGKNKIGGRVVPQQVINDCMPKVGLVNPHSNDGLLYPKNCSTSSEQVYHLISEDNKLNINGIMYDNSQIGRKPVKL